MLTEVRSTSLPKKPNGSNHERQELLKEWMRRSNKAREALDKWRYHLSVWYCHQENNIQDEWFMSIIGEMAEVGMDEFLDGFPDLDRLRDLLTGKEADDV